MYIRLDSKYTVFFIKLSYSNIFKILNRVINIYSSFIHRKGSRTNSLTNLTMQQTQYVKAVNLHSKLATRFRYKSLGISNEKHS